MTARKMTARKITARERTQLEKEMAERKMTAQEMAARKRNVQNIQSEESLKLFAPISIETPTDRNQEKEWLRVADGNKEEIRVTRNPGHGTQFPMNPFHNDYATKQ